SGLRSFDRSMPEEINRVVTDHVSELLFTTEESGNLNLRHEGIPVERIHFVGNCMVDTLQRHVSTAVEREPWRALRLSAGSSAVRTLHGPRKGDADEPLKRILTIVGEVSRRVPIIFPIHPRTRRRMEEIGREPGGGVHLTGPLPYLRFVGLMAKARFVLTDSG